MTLNKLLKEKNLSKYQLANLSHIPYSTICDLFNEKTSLMKCSVEVVYRITKVLDLSMNELVEFTIAKSEVHRVDFEIFKSNLRHQLHDTDDLTFLFNILKADPITTYIERKWFAEALYTLALVDYLSRINNIPYASKYDEIRRMKLDKILYPADVIMMSAVSKSDKIKKESYKNALEEFKRFNIVETEVRNVL